MQTIQTMGMPEAVGAFDPNKRIIDMTAGEFAQVLRQALQSQIQAETSVADEEESTRVMDFTKRAYVYGIAGIAKLFHCSVATANRIKQSGVIDDAITQTGRKIVIDAELALELARKGQVQ